MSSTLNGTRPHQVGGTEAVLATLRRLRTSIPDLRGVMVASVDGLPVAHDLRDADAAGAAAMAATAAGLGKRLIEDFDIGEFAESVVRADSGYFVVYSAGPTAVLACIATDAVNLGRLHLEARRCATSVAEQLAEGVAR